MPSDKRPQDSVDDRLNVTESRASRELLEHGDLTVLGLLRGASNATLLVRLDRGDRSALAVAKPQAGEAPLWDFPEGTLHRNEVAAYELARLLGWPSIPKTILRVHGELGPTALQTFVAHDPEHHALTLGDLHQPQLRAIALFDVIANNADRKAGHVILGEEGALWSIDHGICFSPEPKLRTVLWNFATQQLITAEATAIATLSKGLETPGVLDQLLAPDQMDALKERVSSLIADPRFPKQPSLRPSVPWPPV